MYKSLVRPQNEDDRKTIVHDNTFLTPTTKHNTRVDDVANKSGGQPVIEQVRSDSDPWGIVELDTLSEDLRHWQERLANSRHLPHISETNILDVNIEDNSVTSEFCPSEGTQTEHLDPPAGLSPNIKYSPSYNTTPLRTLRGESKMAVRIPNALCPEPFKEDGEDATLWLKRFKVYIDLMDWDARMAKKSFPLFLTGSAANWYEGLKESDKDTFVTLENAVKERYLPYPAMKWARLDEYSTRIQQ